MKLEFITRARTLIDDCGYPAANHKEMLRDTLVFGTKSDKVRRDAIAIGNDLTYQQVYDLAKTEESTVVQMDIIAGSNSSPNVHAVRSRRGPQSYRNFSQKKNEDGKKQFHPKKKKALHKPCHKCGDEHTKGSCPAKYATCYFCKKIGHYTKVCRKKLRKVNEMTQDDPSDDMNAYNLGEIGTINSTRKSVNNVSGKITHNKDRHIDKIYARVKFIGSHDIKLKVDTGSDTCTLTSTDLQKLQLAVKIKPNNCILNKYGGGMIKIYGSARLKISFLNKSTVAYFKIVRGIRKPINPRMQTSAGVESTHTQRQQHTVSTRNKPTKQTNRSCDKGHADETSSTT